MPTIDYDEVIRILRSKIRISMSSKEYQEIIDIFLEKKLTAEEMEIDKNKYR